MRQSARGFSLAQRRSLLQPLERKREVGSALVAGEGMQFVHDHEPATREMRRVTFLRQHDRETFRRRHKNVRWPAAKFRPLRCAVVSPVRT